MKLKKNKIKKLLIVYSALIVSVSLFLLVALEKKEENKADAANGWTTIATIGNCSGDRCVCPGWLTAGETCIIHVHSCPNGLTNNVCYDNPRQVAELLPGQSLSMDSILTGYDCTYVQVDNNRPTDPSIAGFYGAATLKWNNGDFSVCGGGGGDEPDVPDVAVCPYSSTQARVHTSIENPWVQDLMVNSCPRDIIVGSFHDHTGQFATDTVIRVAGDDVNVGLPNEGTFRAKSGRYVVNVKTKIPNTNDYYQEAACNARAVVNCAIVPVDVDNPGFDISKIASNDNGPYEIGEVVTFRVAISNTGDVALNSIAYRDVFDNRYLQFLSVVGTSPSYPSGVDVTGSFSLSSNGSSTTMSVADLTTVLGDLGVGQIMYLDYQFRATNPSARACNDVFASANGLAEEQARDCVGITISTDL